MIRGGFRFVDEANNDCRYVIAKSGEIEALSSLISKQQLVYAKPVIRMPQD